MMFLVAECLILVLWGIRLILQMQIPYLLAAGIWLMIMLPFHRKRYRLARYQEKRFHEAVLYMNTLLYSFAREEKILRALEASHAACQEMMQESVGKALDILRRTPENGYAMREALTLIEQEWPCMRIMRIHRILLHTEEFGGTVDRQIAMLLEDSAMWEQRISAQIRQRKDMLLQIVMSVAASLILCGMVLGLPVMEGAAKDSPISNLAAVLLVILNDSILFAAQKFLCCDWLTADELREDGQYQQKMQEFRNYDPARDLRLSRILGVFPLCGAVLLLVWGKEGASCICFGAAVVCFSQHRIGRYLARKRLREFLRSAFPLWLMDLTLYLQTDNVHRALERSADSAPAVLKEEIESMLRKIRLIPESSEPYREFLRDFSLPEAEEAMGILFALQMGDKAGGAGQIEKLIAENLKTQDDADRKRLSDGASGLYLLFLAPVVTASMKLIVDMAVFLMRFLANGIGG